MKKLAILSIITLALASCVGARKSNCPAYSLTAIEKPTAVTVIAAK
jgi:hypothetical protein